MTTLLGKSVLITGANKGLGRAFAISYARAGASPLILASRTGASETEAAVLAAASAAGRPTPTIIHITIDVTSQQTITASVTQLTLLLPSGLDILINNSGFMGPEATLLDQPTDEYVKTIDVNLIGTYRVTKAFLPLLLSSPTSLKTIVMLVSVGALGIMASAAYSISKAAVMRFCQFLMLQYGEQGVNSFACHPGGVATELAQGLPDVYKARLVDTPELAGDTMVWLTRERREWLSGRYVAANWDMVELEAMKEKIVEENLLRFRFQLE